MSGGDSQVEVLLACFEGHQRAGKAHHSLTKKLEADGAKILDEVVLTVSAKGKARVYDPRRTVAGALTPALTWGLFGLIASGGSWVSLLVWAVIGGLCGGLYAYYTGHLATKGELARLGKQLSPDSSAVLAYLVGPNATSIRAAASTLQPSAASVATIGSDLSASVLAGGDTPDPHALLTMLLCRYPGQDTAKRVAAATSAKPRTDQPAVELLFNADKGGKYHVASPSAQAFVKSDVAGWGILGLLFGGAGGLFGALEKGVVTGIAWTLFGLLAGTLYGLWSGRAVSARRLDAVRSLRPPDTSMVLAWAEGSPSQDALGPWSAPGSQQLILGFNRTPKGAALQAEAIGAKS